MKNDPVREYVFKFIYSKLASSSVGDDQNLDLDQEIRSFDTNLSDQLNLGLASHNEAKNKIREILMNKLKYDQLISLYARQNSLTKLPKLTHALLITAIHELHTHANVEVIVYFVNLAKKYCPNDADGFVNSILDQVYKSFGKK